MFKPNQAGLTLIEVLIAAIVLQLVLLATSTAFSTMARSYAALEASTAASHRIREVDRFLRDSLKAAVHPGPEAFRYSQDELVWMSPFDRVGAEGGVVWMRLRTEGNRLMLDFAQPAPTDDAVIDATEPDWGGFLESEVLLEGAVLQSVQVRYDEGKEWLTVDDANPSLPSLVKIAVKIAEKEWPPIIVSVGHSIRGT